jgi:preprotein translocase subunit Sss1
MNKVEVKEIVINEISNFINNSLDKEINKILKKTGTQTRDEMISTIKDSIESVFKLLWQKKDFWKTGIS